MTRSKNPSSKRQREAQYYMADAMRRFEWDMHNEIGMQGRIPDAWREIAARRDSPRVKVGFSCDADIVRFFKSMGPGYQRRMNDVLRAFMHARLAGLLEGEETDDMFRHDVWSGGEKPDWGVTGERMGE